MATINEIIARAFSGITSWSSTAGSAHTLQKDESGNTVLPAFSPGTSSNETAAAASARIALGSSTTVRIKGVTAAETFKIAFGDSSVAATATDIHIDTDDKPEVFYVPSGATHMAFIRGGASDVTFNAVLG